MSIFLENNTNRPNLKDNYDEFTKIIKMPPTFELPEKGLGQHLFDAMKKNKYKIAQYLDECEKIDTYASLLSRCIRTSISLKSRGLSKNDIICLCSNNHENSCVPFLAALMAGIPVASCDPSMTLMDVSYLVNLVKPSIFFVIPDMLSIVEKSLEKSGLNSEIVVFGDSDDHKSFQDFMSEGCAQENEFLPTEINDISETGVIMFSSGTTGLPKGIVLSHRALLGQTINFVQSGMLGKVCLTYATLYWISSVMQLIGVTLFGKSRLVVPSFNPETIWHLIDKYRVSFIFSTPNQASTMLKIGRPENLDTSELLCLTTGGGVFNEKHLKQLRQLLPGTAVFQSYGQTEMAGSLTLFRAGVNEDARLLYHKPTGCGRPISNIEYRVVDIETEENCGPNKQGELRVKSPFFMSGYYNLDSSNAYDSEGWLCTGDIVYFDEDLVFYVIDRIKEMFKFRSWHILPAILENVVSSHPAVIQSVVIGIPDEMDGELPMAVVRVIPEFDGNPKDIEKYVEERVEDRLRLRAGVKIVKEIPMTPSGKCKRRELKEMVLKGFI